MNIHNEARTYTSGAEMVSSYSEAKKRLGMGPASPVVAKIKAPEPAVPFTMPVMVSRPSKAALAALRAELKAEMKRKTTAIKQQADFRLKALLDEILAQEADKIRVLMARPTASLLFERVCKETGVAPHQIMSQIRHKNIVAARHRLFHCLNIEGALSAAEIGRLFGVDHTTVLHGVASHKRFLVAQQ